MRTLIASLCLLSAAASASGVSGTLTASFEGWTTSVTGGNPKVKMNLDLSSSLTCPTTAPTLHFGVSAVSGYFVNASTEKTGNIGAGFADRVDPTGKSESINEQFFAGSSIFVRADGVDSWCGNGVNKGGSITLTSQPVHIPPRAYAVLALKQGAQGFIAVRAAPRGSETVTVKLEGGGLDATATYPAADFASGNAKTLIVTPTLSGQVKVTSTLNPANVSDTVLLDIAAGSSGAGGGTGAGGGASAAGGGGGGDSTPPAGGCSTVPGGAMALLGYVLARRRR